MSIDRPTDLVPASGALRRVLMVAFHFPPLTGSSGIQRTLRFARYLPESGWQPVVLTPHQRAYPDVADDLKMEVGPQTLVKRAFALDAARHLSIAGRYPRLLALPDRWSSWWLGAVPLGLWLIRRLQPQVIWSTAPVASAHLIGATLARLSGLPWVAELRDPLVHGATPSDPRVRRAYLRVEQRIVERARRIVVVTPGAARLYGERYPGLAPGKLRILENGFDEASFLRAGAAPAPPRRTGFTLLHSGLLYAGGRNPRQLLAALAKLRAGGLLERTGFRLVLRACGMEDRVRAMALEAGVADHVECLPGLPYVEALTEMLHADGLLVLQATMCNDQIPVKLYEYLRARRPVLALTDPAGDTAALLREAGTGMQAPLDDRDAIAAVLTSFLEMASAGGIKPAAPGSIERFSREGITHRFAALLDEVVAARPGNP